MKKNKRPNADPSTRSGKAKGKGKKSLKVKRNKREAKKKKSKNGSSNGKSKRNKNKKGNGKGSKNLRKKGKKNKNSRRNKGRQEEPVDESDKRTGLIWPWIASITISGKNCLIVFFCLFYCVGEVTCTGFIISPRIVITVTKCFPSLESAR